MVDAPMTQPDNLGLAFLRQVERTPSADAIRSRSEAINYRQFSALVLSFALHLKLRGVDRNSCVAIDTEAVPVAYALLLGISLLGARWVDSHGDLAAHGINVTHHFYTDKGKGAAHPRSMMIDPYWAVPPSGADMEDMSNFSGAEGPDAVWMIGRSSGTTGEPKYMEISYANQWKRIATVAGLAKGRAASLFPPLSPVGVVRPLASLIFGGTLLIERSYSQLLEMGADLILASPAQIDGLIRGRAPLGEKVAVLNVGGGLATARAINEWLRYFSAVNVFYASTEAGATARRSFSSYVTELPAEFDLLDNAVVEIVDDERRPVADGEVGTVRIRTPYMVTGYVDQPEATRQAFDGGWFYPGDLGALTGRTLRIFGRVADQFNLGGTKANAAEIDDAAVRALGVEAAISFAYANERGVDELGVLAKLGAGIDPQAAARYIRQQCSKLRGTALVPRRIYFADRLPYNQNGKPMRNEARDLALAGESY